MVRWRTNRPVPSRVRYGPSPQRLEREAGSAEDLELHPHLGLLSLAAVAERAGHDVEMRLLRFVGREV